jgi:hypothetical protein
VKKECSVTGKAREERLWLHGVNLLGLLYSFSRLLLYAWNMEYAWKGKEKEREREVLAYLATLPSGYTVALWPSCRNVVLEQRCHMCVPCCTRLWSAMEPF